MFEIVEKKDLHETICLIKVTAGLIASKALPGQFVLIRIDEKGERIPLTIVDARDGLLTLIFQKVGKTTVHLGTLSKGDSLADVVGPLGKPSEIKKYGTVVCIGGGIGIAEEYPVARAFKEAGNYCISIIGARTKSLLILEDEMRAASDELLITTDDGSYGVKGLVIDELRKIIDRGKPISLVMAVGPVVMMKAVAEVTRPYGIKTLVSLNSIMVDGTGMCGACRVSVGGKTKFACVDGPDFDAHEVDFDLMIGRLKMYLADEKRSLEEFTKKQAVHS
ncbi:MAG: sulfide/dihydroorotate dehydrogenase-like FAD/NAD-binding protein [Candidatus Eisenbacteria bacterium]|nr:sulfide/dihydroorotate dehydrogenase-like FAD/NAD-binding protein [Candidatus Eisenbacteria bacterium]